MSRKIKSLLFLLLAQGFGSNLLASKPSGPHNVYAAGSGSGGGGNKSTGDHAHFVQHQPSYQAPAEPAAAAAPAKADDSGFGTGIPNFANQAAVTVIPASQPSSGGARTATESDATKDCGTGNGGKPVSASKDDSKKNEASSDADTTFDAGDSPTIGNSALPEGLVQFVIMLNMLNDMLGGSSGQSAKSSNSGAASADSSGSD